MADNIHYGDMGTNPEYPMAPIEEFSEQDNQLLMSVLNSTPMQEQYQQYTVYQPQYAQYGPQMQLWDTIPNTQQQGYYTGKHFHMPSLECDSNIIPVILVSHLFS